MSRTPAKAKVVGRHAGKYVWLKTDVFPNVLLTMPDSVLPRGTKQAYWVEIEVDPDSLYNDGIHYRADLKVVREAGPGPG